MMMRRERGDGERGISCHNHHGNYDKDDVDAEKYSKQRYDKSEANLSHETAALKIGTVISNLIKILTTPF